MGIPVRRRRYNLTLLLAVFGCNFMDRQLLGVLMPAIKAEFTASDTLLGLLAGPAFALFYTTLGVPLAVVADRASRAWLITARRAERRYIQFIPIVERVNADGWSRFQEGNTVTERSVGSEQWGRFLIAIFDDWVKRDVGTVFVQMFDAALASWVGAPPAICIFAETCGDAVALEHKGDVYSGDHFVEPKYLLGNISEKPLLELVASPPQRAFGAAKRDTLPRYCRECPVRFACHGECPKNRFILTPDGELGLNYLCAGYKAFFTHVDRPMRLMAELPHRGRYADEAMGILAAEAANLAAAAARSGRNEPCPCGSGRKAKRCHGRVPSTGDSREPQRSA